jgi:hypothetical protein
MRQATAEPLVWNATVSYATNPYCGREAGEHKVRPYDPAAFAVAPPDGRAFSFGRSLRIHSARRFSIAGSRAMG